MLFRQTSVNGSVEIVQLSGRGMQAFADEWAVVGAHSYGVHVVDNVKPPAGSNK